MMNKRAQIYGQIFIYILLILVFASILVYGVYAISQLVMRAERIEIEKFKMDMKNLVAENREYNTVDVVEVKLPSKFSQLCFVDSTALGTTVSVHTTETAPKEIHLINDKIMSGAKDNMFLYPPGSESYDVGKIQVSGSSKCFGADYNHNVKIKFRGLGDKTEILEIP